MSEIDFRFTAKILFPKKYKAVLNQALIILKSSKTLRTLI